MNARLASDLSSDPKFPKIQFPREEACAECRAPKSKNSTIVTSPGYGVSDIAWNKRIVLDFLKKHYGPDNIRLRDKNPFIADAEDDESDTVRKSFYMIISGAGITSLETSLCVLIYCTVMIVILGLYFYLINRRRKKDLRHIV